ncbi:MAG: GH3 auxin-responsive promoter family protein [Elainellaceae cyanobacterium]
MVNPVLAVLAAIVRRSKADFIRKTHRAEEVQATFLRALLKAHRHTEFSRRHGLSDVQTIEQFREQIPVQPYSAFAPYTQRMVNGETNLLMPDPLIYVNISSGSTGQKKFIPVTARSRRFLSRGSRTAMGFVADATIRDGRSLGKMLFPISVNPVGYTPTGLAYAPVSTSDLRLMGAAYRQVFAHPSEAFQVSDTLARYYLCLLFALKNPNLRIIGATFPVLALQLCGYLEQNADDLIHDLETGTIASWLAIDPPLRAKLERQWSAAPERAAQLRHSLKANGRLVPNDAWRDLSFLITARGGTSNFYFERFPEYFGDTPIFGGTYACAEGVLGVHRDFNTDSTILAIESGFYEFIPEDQWAVEHPKTLLPWEVKAGDRYRIVLTNYSGFYRYDLGDVVEIDGFYGQAPLMIFRHRRGGVMSSSTEKTTEDHVVCVMQRLQQQFGVSLENFCITLSDDTIPSHYLVNIELVSGATLPDPEAFLQQFDNTLKEVQAFYAIKRRDQIPLPRLRILAPGSFEQVRQQMIQQGVAEAQLKFPHVSEDRTFLNGLTVQQEIRLAGDRCPVVN